MSRYRGGTNEIVSAVRAQLSGWVVPIIASTVGLLLIGATYVFTDQGAKFADTASDNTITVKASSDEPVDVDLLIPSSPGGKYLGLTENSDGTPDSVFSHGHSHGTLSDLSSDDHAQYLLAAGTRALTGNLATGSGITIDGRDLSVDGAKLDGFEGASSYLRSDVADQADGAITFAANPKLADDIEIELGSSAAFSLGTDAADMFLFDGAQKILSMGIDEPANYAAASGAGNDIWFKGQGAAASSGGAGSNFIFEPGARDGAGARGRLYVYDANSSWWTSMANAGGTALFDTNGSTLLFQVSSGTNVLTANASRNLFSNNYEVAWGGDIDVAIDYSTAQASGKCGVIGFGSGTTDQAYNLIFTTLANRNKDHDHGIGTDPTLFVHSATNPDTANTQWVSMTHNQTDAVLTSGTGNITLAPASYVVLSSSKGTTGDPTGAEGMIYINTFDNAVKMYADGAWRTLVSW